MADIKFIKSVGKLNQLPKLQLPELILCGRSNVGKSSFINSLFERKNLAKTSSTPGKTRTINYYLVNQKYHLVDLPGFGYAKVSKSERSQWQKLIENFLYSSPNIQFAIHLIDSRHNPTNLDIQLNNALRELDLPYLILLTKVDKLKQSEKAKAQKEIVNFFPELIPGENLFLYSSVKGTGKKEISSLLHKMFD